MAKNKETEAQAPEAPKPGTAVMSIQEQIAAQIARQNETAQGLRSSGSFIGFKNAILRVDGIAIPANQLDVRVLAALSERAWYSKDFDADVVLKADDYNLIASQMKHCPGYYQVTAYQRRAGTGVLPKVVNVKKNKLKI